ncbi:serine/threonine-protein kinase SAPK5-like [Triticum urartu]|uniref:serine/threonine-protein kinase SAPK5-like n=1 Tax=Triticum urartu TaxID=4572 RepID=UPI0020430A4A|nr:serine/threonine-protein kinase SAPK5-like [Triticum urartu]
MAEIKAHPWFLKNLPRELKEEARQAYYNRRHVDVAPSSNDSAAGVGASATASSNGAAAMPAPAPAYSAQSVEEIMMIVQEAQTVPKPDKPVSGYG